MGRKLLNKYPIVDYFFITVGAALMSLGIGVFLVDARVVPGGVSGLAMAIHYLSDNNLPVGLMIWILNVPLYIWGVKELGKRFGLKPGQAIMFIDFFIVALAGFIIYIKDLSPDRPAFTLVLYAIFLLFVSARIIDVIIDGFDYARVAYIISDKSKEIAKAIMNDLSRGATAIKTRGLYKDIEREVLFTIVTLKELGKLTEIIKEIDPDAFVIINNVHEVLGNGFRRRI